MSGQISPTGRRETPDGMWLLPDITQETWREDAACSFHQTPQLWDPPAGGPSSADRTRWAQAATVCADCPVINQCAAAVNWRDAGAIRAGLQVDPRGQLVRIPTAPPPKPTPVRGRHTDATPAVCGSPSAKKRHYRRGEDCHNCWPTGKPSRAIANCGTDAAKRRHRRNNEDCLACGITQDTQERGAA